MQAHPSVQRPIIKMTAELERRFKKTESHLSLANVSVLDDPLKKRIFTVDRAVMTLWRRPRCHTHRGRDTTSKACCSPGDFGGLRSAGWRVRSNQNALFRYYNRGARFFGRASRPWNFPAMYNGGGTGKMSMRDTLLSWRHKLCIAAASVLLERMISKMEHIAYQELWNQRAAANVPKW